MKRNPLITSVLFILTVFLLTMPVFASTERGVETEDLSKPPSQARKTIQSMKFPPLKVQIPRVGREVERVVLDNGMILYLRVDRSFPRVQIAGVIRTGTAYEKREKFGVAQLTGQVMRSGGTKKLSPDELNDKLDFMAASVETSMSPEFGAIGMDVIKSQLEPAFDLFAQVLTEPAFDEKQLDLAKASIKNSLIRRNERIQSIGLLEFFNLIYPDYSRGWEYDWKTVKAITRHDLENWHRRFYRPGNMMFAVVGDFNRDEIIALFNKHFGSMDKTPADLSGLHQVEKQFKPGIYSVKKDVNQSYILMGHLGVKRGHKDRFALEVMDYILGSGGFRSYMMEKVRSDEGLAYSVGSFFSLESRVYGTAGAYSSTRADATVRALELMLSVIDKIRTKPVSKEKLEETKSSIINSFLFKFEDPLVQTRKLMMLEYDGMPADYYENYCRQIEKVTAEDVMRVAREHLRPEQFTIIVVGRTDRLDKPLSSLNRPVKEIELKQFQE